RAVEELEDDALHLLDHPLGVYRPAVVDDEADAERRAVLAHLAAEVSALHLHRCSGRAKHRRPHGRVERDVRVAGPGEPVPRGLAAATIHERPRAPAESSALQAVAPLAVMEDAGRIDAHRLQGRNAVRDTLRVER